MGCGTYFFVQILTPVPPQRQLEHNKYLEVLNNIKKNKPLPKRETFKIRLEIIIRFES
jgi:hypothetical protein